MADTGTTGRHVRDDGAPAFTKTGGAFPGMVRFEAAGLRALAAAGARVPEVMAVEEGRDARAQHLEIAWIQGGGRRTPRTEEAFGRELVALHAGSRRAPGETDLFGAHDGAPEGFLGAARIDLTPCRSWAESWVVRRIVPLAAQAVDGGAAPARVRHLAERLGEVTDGFGPDSPATHPGAAVLGAAEPSSLVHGDLWAGNRMLDHEGRSWLIDPSAQRAHREADLAMMRLFGGFGEEAFAAYDEAFPLADGWEDRVPVYQAVPLLVHAVLFGGGYGREAEAALEHAVRLAG
ncbi:fructosamine kinase family protein [Micrococcus sp.]|uniref:fructosamine kinase family protein n=1 Tax=Micrococcus sp. TaxID=1271 RepID=UPI0026DB4931|nr:fructosamine kinase family protein [Micrococcus sp.]MDO4238828.1 fructosamine kinase family protein [Micrococcus sp.]